MDDIVRRAYEEAEATTFPPVPDEQVWCSLRGLQVPVEECASSCAAPEQKPVCWLGRFYTEEPMEGGAG